MLAAGLSPRVRGNHFRSAITRWRDGSIPASAGEPVTVTVTANPARVYPRECGGTRKPPLT